ncbi:RNA polymerase sigma factor SigI [Peribacillus acanthi]|uniref:RNA polymerase sigma factor SigI n=1 Tax=Peribacillus acanthi TaxID=2171554 RepID=UPI001F0BFCD1|nr:RNA polymerase sigma factor SigI [Peribacillus acanthi]
MRPMLSLLFSALSSKKRNLEESIFKIQDGDLHLRNEIIKSFKPFIAKTASSVCRRYIRESDDEFSIGLIAFNEALDKYDREKGSSLISFAETLIKRRVIDYLRSQSRKQQDLLMDMQSNDEEEQAQNYLEAEQSMQQFQLELESQKRKDEILQYTKNLKEFDVSFSDLVECSPKHVDSRQSAIFIAKTLINDPEMLQALYEKKRLPIKQLESKVDVSRKTIERNRKYIIALAIILCGDYIYLKDYLKGVQD